MHYFIPRRAAFVMALSAVLLTGSGLRAQNLHTSGRSDMPDTPLPAAQQQPAQPDPQSSSQPSKSKQDQAAEDLKKEEKQRILGIMPDFNMMNNADAPPLSPSQKFHLFF